MKKKLLLILILTLTFLDGYSQAEYNKGITKELIKVSLEFNNSNYSIRVKTTIKNEKYKSLIKKHFYDSFLKNISNKKENGVIYDCEIDLVFDKLTVKDEKYTYNKHFSKVVNGFQAQSDDGPTIFSETVRGYVYQIKKMRKLNWNIISEINSDSNNCKSTNNNYTEKIISRSFNNTISGDERAISGKYKKLEEPLLSEESMVEEAIKKVYIKIKHQLKRID